MEILLIRLSSIIASEELEIIAKKFLLEYLTWAILWNNFAYSKLNLTLIPCKFSCLHLFSIFAFALDIFLIYHNDEAASLTYGFGTIE